jgi:type VI secretion system secreted protein Hcp
MAFSAWINMGDDAKGESLDKDHTDWIDITWCGHQIVQPQTTARGSAGGTTSQAEHGDFQFRKLVDKSTAKLYELVCNGKHLPKVTVDFSKPIGGKPTKYMVTEMKNVVVSGVHMDADSGGASNYPTETVTVSYDAISWTYTQVAQDGTSKGNVAANWSRATGVSQ